MVKNLNAEEQYVELENGRKINYDKLLVASGARPKKWKYDQDGVFSVREFADVEKIKNYTEGKDIKDVVIVGGNFIGTESSSSIKDAFKDSNVTILNRNDFLF